MKPLFVEETTAGYKLVACGIISLVLIILDHNSDLLDDVRSGLTVALTPVIIVADYPRRTIEWVADVFISHGQLRERVQEMEGEILLLRAQTQRMASLSIENRRLRDLLGSAAKLTDNVLVAELIGVDTDPDRHIVSLDKGTRDGVFVGQPLLDAGGLMGQVIEVSRFMSRVLLITDSSHSVPVQVNRNNLRMIAVGSGATRELELIYVPDTADVREGDLLVSSGLGGKFPVGYPVGTVRSVVHDPGQPFAAIRATPSASLANSRHVLLVFTDKPAAVGEE